MTKLTAELPDAVAATAVAVCGAVVQTPLALVVWILYCWVQVAKLTAVAGVRPVSLARRTTEETSGNVPSTAGKGAATAAAMAVALRRCRLAVWSDGWLGWRRREEQRRAVWLFFSCVATAAVARQGTSCEREPSAAINR